MFMVSMRLRTEEQTKAGSTHPARRKLRGGSIGDLHGHKNIQHMLIQHIRKFLSRFRPHPAQQIKSYRGVLQLRNGLLIELDHHRRFAVWRPLDREAAIAALSLFWHRGTDYTKNNPGQPIRSQPTLCSLSDITPGIRRVSLAASELPNPPVGENPNDGEPVTRVIGWCQICPLGCTPSGYPEAGKSFAYRTSKLMGAPSAKLLGRYEIVAELGRGGMGVVYKARDPKIDRFVAIKTILLHQSGVQEQREFRERFFVEAQAAGRLLHPGIVAVFDVGEEPGTSDPYIVMEYIEGQTLRELLVGQNGKLPLESALRITQELAEALDYAHAQGVVHRDLKPANILVTKEGQAKIGDFGIAQLDLTHMTLPGRVLGTPAYMSPEQLEGEQVDGRSDLFSLGAILYYMLTGFSPFQGNSATTVCFKVANRDPLQATALAPELPPELDAIISRALAKDPSVRYQRGMEFATDLRQLREGATNPPKGHLWFQPSEGRRTWLDKAANRPISTAITPGALSKKARPIAAEGKSRTLLSRIPSSGMLVGPLISFFVAAIVLGFLAWRQIRIANPSATTVTESANRESVRESTPGIQSLPVAVANAQNDSAMIQSDNQTETAAAIATASPKAAVNPAISKLMAPAVPKAGVKARSSPVASKALPKPIEPAAPPLGPNLAFADSNVEVRVENHFSDGILSIWIDDKLAYEHALHDGHKKKLILLGGGIKETVTLPLPSGKHTVRVVVRSPKEKYDESQTVAGDFLKGGEKVLSINFDKHTREMRATLSDDLTAHPHQ